MDRIKKVLQKLNAEDRLQIKKILKQLYSGNFRSLDIKKLKGRNDIFRVRKGDFRIIYRFKDKNIFILTIGHRRESTYRF